MKKLFLYLVICALLVHIVFADPWFDTSCQKKRNISLTDIVGTQTVNMTFTDDLIFDFTLNNNESNFTFSDASQTNKLNFYIESINATAKQAMFWVNISNNSSIFLYYDCALTESDDTKTGVMSHLADFDEDLDGWGAHDSNCSLVNLTRPVTHLGRRGNQVLNASDLTPGAGGCHSPGNLNINNSFVNVEFLISSGTSLDQWMCTFPENSEIQSCNGIFPGVTQKFASSGNPDSWQMDDGSGFFTIMNLPNDEVLSKFYRIRWQWNSTGPDVPVFSWINGTQANARNNGIFKPGFLLGGLKTGGDILYLDSVKVWIQNNATTITFGNAINFSGIANESVGRSAIEAGINGALTGNTIFTDHVVHVRLANSSQFVGQFDKAVEKGNQFWAFNYITAGDSFTNMPGIQNVFFVWENQSLSSNEITLQVGTLINTTKN